MLKNMPVAADICYGFKNTGIGIFKPASAVTNAEVTAGSP